MKFNLTQLLHKHIGWIVIAGLALIAVVLRISLNSPPAQTAQIAETPLLPATPTPDLTGTVEQIYVNANQTLTAIYAEATPLSTPTPAQSGLYTTQPAQEVSPLVEEVESNQTGQAAASSQAQYSVSVSKTPAPAVTSQQTQSNGSTATPTATLVIQPSETLAPQPTATQITACDFQTNPAFETNLLVLINQIRESNGLPTLEVDETLANVARGHSQEMACRDYYDHTSYDGSSFLDRMRAANFLDFAKATELLYVGRGNDNSPNSAFEAWLGGPSSYTQLLYPSYNTVGIGYAYKENSTYGGYFTLILLTIPPPVDQ